MVCVVCWLFVNASTLLLHHALHVFLSSSPSSHVSSPPFSLSWISCDQEISSHLLGLSGVRAYALSGPPAQVRDEGEVKKRNLVAGNLLGLFFQQP